MERSGDRKAAARSRLNDPRGARSQRPSRHDANLPYWYWYLFVSPPRSPPRPRFSTSRFLPAGSPR
eukprot:3806132-Pyramimonas_sp.AAC.1